MNYGWTLSRFTEKQLFLSTLTEFNGQNRLFAKGLQSF